MTSLPYDPSLPPPSGEFEFTDPDRYEDIDRKHRRLGELMLAYKLDGILLQDPANFRWITAGAPCPGANPGEVNAAVFLTPDARLIAANNIDAPWLFDRKMGGLGFQLKQRPWHEPREILLNDLCRGRAIGTDLPLSPPTAARTKNLAGAIQALRIPLTATERERIRILGRDIAGCVESTARTLEVGQTETEILGQLTHRLIRHQVTPVSLRVCVDGRSNQYRHWVASSNSLARLALITACGERDGLHCSATRTVLFGLPSGSFIEMFQKSTMLLATGMAFTQAGQRYDGVWPKVKRIYDKLNLPNEWQLADQAEVTGYRPLEIQITPTTKELVEPHSAVHWHPSVAGAMVGETILTTNESYELLTPATDWPMITITVRGRGVELPDLLLRPMPHQTGQA